MGYFLSVNVFIVNAFCKFNLKREISRRRVVGKTAQSLRRPPLGQFSFSYKTLPELCKVIKLSSWDSEQPTIVKKNKVIGLTLHDFNT